MVGSWSSGSSGPRPKTSCSTSSLICFFLAAGEQGGLLLHDGQDGLPHFRADAVVFDAGQGVQVDLVEQLAVQRELQLLVFRPQVGPPRAAAQQALLPARSPVRYRWRSPWRLCPGVHETSPLVFLSPRIRIMDSHRRRRRGRPGLAEGLRRTSEAVDDRGSALRGAGIARRRGGGSAAPHFAPRRTGRAVAARTWPCTLLVAGVAQHQLDVAFVGGQGQALGLCRVTSRVTTGTLIDWLLRRRLAPSGRPKGPSRSAAPWR